MHPTALRTLRALGVTSIVLPVLFGCGQLAASAQTGSVSTAPPRIAAPVTQYDPTLPETQPALTVDRDPVLSPDAEDNQPPEAQGAVSVQGPAGTIQKAKSGLYTLRENVDEVVLNCTVVDRKKQLVRGLTRGDFQVWEDGVPQTVGSFRFQDLPVSMGILIDNSGSMRDKRAAVSAAALDLVRASNPKDEAFIVNFSDRAYLDQDFTSNLNALEHGLAHVDSKNLTALYDAVVASADELSKHSRNPKQVLLIVTDGADNASRLTLDQAIRRVQRLGGPVVYTIGLLTGDDKKEAEQTKAALEELSNETGGIAYFPESVDSVDGIAGEVAQDIREQYTLGYHSTRSPSLGGFRTVRVEARAPKLGRLIVRTRHGYYPKAAQKPDNAKTPPAAPSHP